MGKRLTTLELHGLILNALNKNVQSHSDLNSKPLYVNLLPPYNWTLKIYLFNCTNPPGARQAGEYKSQLILPNQKRGERGSFTVEPGVITLLMGFASITDENEDGIYIIWELKKHMEFSYSANIQVSLRTLLKAYTAPMFTMKKRGNKEWIVIARPFMLMEAIKKRIDVDIGILLEE